MYKYWKQPFNWINFKKYLIRIVIIPATLFTIYKILSFGESYTLLSTSSFLVYLYSLVLFSVLVIPTLLLAGYQQGKVSFEEINKDQIVKYTVDILTIKKNRKY